MSNFLENKNRPVYLEKTIKLTVKLIPPGMTGLLQPLDVAVNRSFQTFYEQEFAAYVELSDNKQSGQIKIPDYNTVASWVIKWKKSYKANVERNPFVICGFVHPEQYDVKQLHKPLYELIQKQLDINEWESAFKDELCELKDLFDGEEDKYFFPTEDKFTLRDAIYFNFPEECSFMKTIEDDIVDDRVIERIAIDLDLIIELIDVNEDLYVEQRKIFNKTEPPPPKTMIIGRMGDYYFSEKFI